MDEVRAQSDLRVNFNLSVQTLNPFDIYDLAVDLDER